MPTFFNLPEQEYLPGIYQHVINQIAGPKQELELSFTRVNWPLTPVDIVLEVKVEASFTNGSTWVHVTTQGFGGGEDIDRFTGLPLEKNLLGWSWPGVNDGNGNRQVVKPDQCRITIEIFETLTSAILYETIVGNN